MRPAKIYALFDPREPLLYRYVGKTCRTLAQRLWEHCYMASKGRRSAKDNWIRGLSKIGIKPEIILLEDASQEWVAKEAYWIKAMRECGHRPLNLTEGGEGSDGYKHTPETRAKMKGRVVTKEEREHLSRLLKGRPIHSAETRKAMSEKRRGRKLPQWQKDFLSKIHTGRKTPPEVIEKMRKYRATPETREKISQAGKGRVVSDQTRAKMSRSRKGRALSSGHVEHVRQALLRPDSGLLRGSSNPSAKLTEDQVREMRRKYREDGRRMNSLAHEYGVSCTVSQQIIRRKKWKHVAD